MRRLQLVFASGLLIALVAVLLPARANAQSQEDKDFLAFAAQADQNEIAMSKVAEEKAANPAVKAFAEKMVKEHTEFNNKMKPFAEQWGVTLPTGPDGEHQQEMDKLNSLSGAAFDKQYIDYMVTDHDHAFKKFTAEVKDTRDAKFRATVMKGKSMIAAHKSMAYSLQKKL